MPLALLLLLLALVALAAPASAPACPPQGCHVPPDEPPPAPPEPPRYRLTLVSLHPVHPQEARDEVLVEVNGKLVYGPRGVDPVSATTLNVVRDVTTPVRVSMHEDDWGDADDWLGTASPPLPPFGPGRTAYLTSGPTAPGTSCTSTSPA